jgi:hypothetical protein
MGVWHGCTELWLSAVLCYQFGDTTTREALPRLTFHSVRMPPFLGYPRVGAIAYTFGGLATSAKAEVLNGNVRFWREAVMQTQRRQCVDTRPFPHRTTSRPGWGIIEVSKSPQHSGFLTTNSVQEASKSQNSL